MRKHVYIVLGLLVYSLLLFLDLLWKQCKGTTLTSTPSVPFDRFHDYAMQLPAGDRWLAGPNA